MPWYSLAEQIFSGTAIIGEQFSSALNNNKNEKPKVPKIITSSTITGTPATPIQPLNLEPQTSRKYPITILPTIKLMPSFPDSTPGEHFQTSTTSPSERYDQDVRLTSSSEAPQPQDQSRHVKPNPDEGNMASLAQANIASTIPEREVVQQQRQHHKYMRPPQSDNQSYLFDGAYVCVSSL
ncbi:hypothetical protein Pst134EA_009708 [Puccinia striiformis f. sp. tritici]|uniref:Uncharacterized protein n=1 Tax=Puccinia striiformis f. sp. tritici PST-78 TaxID=1165861 RepID=A0A0L0V1G1_9BASI|nr:hypothetical protein Pst134EA_009708 [Puccinia striiformis f. sp. tritici]KAH9469179.1 hypothetical protein Pst134EA_009708 [Puccinia striiformis f. sp. tritici]KAI9621509.1 hypothetical protein KEM48_007744 [Puccinia striiformis f. sp. tritici PST-130]KNE93103.1 hypothetical protein PSTG_13492 [Puccinia striiformis f. sp. tritici PST-78]